MKKIFFIVVTALWSVMQTLNAQIIDVRVKTEPFTHYWSVGVGAGRANEGRRAGWLEHLQLVKKIVASDMCGCMDCSMTICLFIFGNLMEKLFIIGNI